MSEPGSHEDRWEELRGFIDAVVEDTLSDEQQFRLNQLLREDDEAVVFYTEYMNLSADLHRMAEESMPPEAVEIALESELSKRYYDKRRIDWGAAAAAVLIIGFVGLALLGTFPGLSKYMPYMDHFKQQPLAVNYASVTASDRALINGAQAVVGQRLGTQDWVLEAGTLSIQFESGTTATLHAPARFNLTGYNNLYLHQGAVLSQVPPEAVGYVVETPDATVVDLGTRFGVRLSPTLPTEVHVFKGKVHTRLNEETEHDSGVNQPNVNLETGHAVRIERSSHRIVDIALADESRFLQAPAPTLAASGTRNPSPAAAAAPAPLPWTYFEDFEGNRDQLLNGTALDAAPAGVTWRADARTRRDGRFSKDHNAYTLLPFRPEAGHTYTLSIEVFPTGDNENASFEAAILGFVNGSALPPPDTPASMRWHSMNAPRTWMQLTGDSLAISSGPEIEHFNTEPENPFAKRTLKIVLDTHEPAWKVSWYVGTGFVSEKLYYANPTDIDHISFGTIGFEGVVDNLKLLVE